MIHLEVAVAAPVSSTLTYSLADEKKDMVQPGIRLLVPLGNRQVTGYLLGTASSVPTDFQVKPVTNILDRQPLFPQNLIPFFRWIASYYRYPLGQVIKCALPGGLAPQSGRQVRLLPEGLIKLTHYLTENQDRSDWLAELLEKQLLSPSRVRSLWRTRKCRNLLEKWQEQGCIVIEELISDSRVKPKTEICVGLVDEAKELTEKLKVSEQKTLALLEDMLGKRPFPLVPRREINRLYSGAGKALKSLIDKGWIFFSEQQVLRDPFGEEPPFFPAPEKLSQEQEQALEELLPAISQKTFTPFLLHGVTGSGKTEVYLQATQKTLDENRSVLVLVPEIALASQLEAHFFSRFGSKVALLHSGLSDGERYDQWCQIMKGKARIVIGARSAIFAPLPDPGLIIVDEEHDGAYKQDDTLRYQARDLAVLRAKLQNCPVLLGSATPSLTSFYHTTTGKYQLLQLSKRIENRPLPEVRVIDLRLLRTDSAHFFFSPELLEGLKQNLAQGNQSIIFLNRRGYANLMICQDCGSPVKCHNCNISLTLHKGQELLCCHYCGYSAKSAIICPSCRSAKVKKVGFGTERLEEALSQRFPKARIARLDRDTATQRKKYLQILKKVHNQEIDILVGTQMITKGHHFPQVTLVGVIWADAGLGMPDYKAGERTFQLISQVTGRAGRGDKPGTVIIQTHQPDHYAITYAQKHHYLGFYEKELQLRRALQFPPFSRLIHFEFSGEQEAKVKNAAQRTALVARKMSPDYNADVLGPAAAPLSKLRGKYRWQLLLKGSDISSLHTLCNRIFAELGQSTLPGKVSISVDVDPETMM